MTKPEMISAVAEEMTGTPKVQVRAFMDAMCVAIGKSLRENNEFVLPGIVKLVVVKVPAKPARQARNPSTGKTITVPPKPPSSRLKARFLKGIKVELGQLPPPPPRAKRVYVRKAAAPKDPAAPKTPRAPKTSSAPRAPRKVAAQA